METSPRTPGLVCASCGAPFTAAVPGQSRCDRCQDLLPQEPVTSPMSGTVIAGCRLVHELGAGRFSTSWLAEDEGGVAVVVKLLRSYAPDPASVQRFVVEAERLASSSDLDHPHIAHLLSGGVTLASALFLVYQSGGEQTLADELRARGRVAPVRALELCAQLAEGLAIVHRAGVLHLDLKPANVALARLPDGTEQAVLLDVATAHLLASSGLRPSQPLPLASAAYLAPEEAPDGRADHYALGVLLYQLISGRLPFMGATADELLRAHREQPALRLRDAGRKVHAELEAVLARLLSKDPAQRYGDGDELAVVLRSLKPLADTAPMEDGPEAPEDPVPVVQAPRPEPEVAPPPPPPPLDPLLERALLGEVPAPEAAAPARRRPVWLWPAAAVVALGVAIAVVRVLTARRPHETAPLRAPAATGPATATGTPTATGAATSTATATPTETPDPIAPPTPTTGSGTSPATTTRTSTSTPSPFARDLERAQKQLWTGQAPAAAATLQRVLASPKLQRHDRARASKLMGDAEQKRGNRAGATAWYRRALPLFDDPGEREKLERLLQK